MRDLLDENRRLWAAVILLLVLCDVLLVTILMLK